MATWVNRGRTSSSRCVSPFATITVASAARPPSHPAAPSSCPPPVTIPPTCPVPHELTVGTMVAVSSTMTAKAAVRRRPTIGRSSRSVKKPARQASTAIRTSAVVPSTGGRAVSGSPATRYATSGSTIEPRTTAPDPPRASSARPRWHEPDGHTSDQNRSVPARTTNPAVVSARAAPSTNSTSTGSITASAGPAGSRPAPSRTAGLASCAGPTARPPHSCAPRWAAGGTGCCAPSPRWSTPPRAGPR